MIRTLLLLWAVAFSVGTQAQGANAPPIEDFWKLPAFTNPVLSANGRYFAVTAPVRGRLNLFVIDMVERKGTALTGYDDFDVIAVQWVGNERLVYSLGQFNSPTGPGEFEGGGLFSISRDGKESRRLSPTVREMRRSNQFVYRGMRYLARVPDSDEEILAIQNERSEDALDVYRVNVRTGRKVLLTENRPALTEEWVLDRERVPRVTVAALSKQSTVAVVHYRDDKDSPWRELWRFDLVKPPVTYPLAFDEDGRNLIVASNEGRDTMAIFRYDVAGKRLGELIAQHPRFDMGANQLGAAIPGVILSPKDRKVVGFAVEATKWEVVWTDLEYAKLQKAVDAALPKTINRFSRTPDGKRLLVTAYSDREPARWYFMDEEKRTLEELFASRPWLDESRLVEMKPFTYKTRDGQEFLAYLFLPRQRKDNERLPTVVHIHGGPHVRADRWGFGSFGSIEGQLLASRGYAVVVPNFRITPGLGAGAFYSGFRQMGQAMQEDIEDATDWAIAQGIADPKRICLSGASYGGYATLMGLAKTPDKYRCGIAGLAVTDLVLQLTSPVGDTVHDERALRFWKALAGDPDKDGDAMRAVSPAYQAAKIKAPILMYSGIDDIRVPFEQPQKMRKALEAAGKRLRWIAKAKEGHGFGLLENNVDLYNQVLEFLAEHIGSKPTQ